MTITPIKVNNKNEIPSELFSEMPNQSKEISEGRYTEYTFEKSLSKGALAWNAVCLVFAKLMTCLCLPIDPKRVELLEQKWITGTEKKIYHVAFPDSCPLEENIIEGPQITEGPQIRHSPPISFIDTVDISGPKPKSIHGQENLFSDEKKIIGKEDIIRVEDKDGVRIGYTKHGKAIILQQAARGCTAAAVAMLVNDPDACLPPSSKLRVLDNNYLRMRNLGDFDWMKEDIESATGKPAKFFSFITNNLKTFKRHLEQYGSCIVAFKGELGGHVVVVDHINEDFSVRLRDPYHGWEITVTKEAFLEEWDPRAGALGLNPLCKKGGGRNSS